jgi:tetratricopeptide (TPR) repeat protein
MEEIPIKDAFTIASSNRESRWPARGQENRLEPFCLPALRPKFKLRRGSTVFTIGSCFARSIKTYLGALGFEIPTTQFFNSNRHLLPGRDLTIFNRYTPASIYQELKWVRGILDRDDRVTMGDVEPFLLDVGRGLVCDLGRLPFQESGITPEGALDDRRLLYDVFKLAFRSDAVVITLGLIECWWDRQQQTYVEFNRHLIRHPDRFAFRRLDYPAALEFVRQTIDIVSQDRPIPILMTTSPVPLQRTFTRDDVIVANTYAKSVLRAVAEVVRVENELVDYFPSYESVMLSRDGSVWMDDLIHVQPGFVSSIMLRVMKSYVDIDEAAAAVTAVMLEVIRCVTQDKWEEAKSAYARIELGRAPLAPTEFYACAAELLSRFGDGPEVIRISERGGDHIQGDYGLRIAKALEGIGEIERGRARREAVLASAAPNKSALWNWLTFLQAERRVEDLEWLLGAAPRFVADDPDGLWRLAQINQNNGRLQQAEELYRLAIRLDPEHEDARLRLAYLLFDTKRPGEGLDVLEKLAADGCENLYLHPLVPHLVRTRRRNEAKALLDRLIRANPGHSGLQELKLE